jgi:osmoprotectant transport system substrate-binding protein
MNRTRATAVIAAFAAGALALTACGSSSSSTPASSSSSSAAASAPASAPAASSSAPAASGAASSSAPVAAGSGSSSAAAPGGGSESITIGSANFSESVLLADIYGEALKAKGVNVTYKPKIGSREVYIPAIKDGSIDMIPDYSGGLLAYVDPKSTATSSEDIYKALPAAIGPDLKVLDQSQAQDKDSIAVTEATASKYNLKSIADLKDHAADLTLGAAPEFKTRADGVPGLKSTYGVEFGTFKTLDAGGPLTVAGLKNGQVDAANVFTTDPSIEANKFVVLTDPKNLYAAQNVLPLLSAKKVTPDVTAASNAVSSKLTTDTLVELNSKVASGTDPTQVAQEWLKAQGLS